MASNITGPVLAAAQGILSESSVQMHRLGELAISNDGRAFKYCKAGATALVMGKLQQSSAEDTTNFQNLTVTAPTLGDTTIVTTSTVTLTKDQLAGGLITIASATTGQGQVLRIKGHAAASAAVVTFNLEDSVILTCTGTVTVDCIPNPMNALVVNPTTATSAPAGIAVYNVTAAYFGWVQVSGPACVLSDGGDAVGTSVVASNGTAGAVEDVASTTQAIVGTRLTGVATTEYGFVNIALL